MERILFRTPLTIRIMTIFFLLFGVLSMYKCSIVGILMYVSALFFLFRMQELSITLNDILDYNVMNQQRILFVLFLFVLTNIVIYKYQQSQCCEVHWEPLKFTYGEYNSENSPCKGWFSGKKDNNDPLDKITGALGFWFCHQEKSAYPEPVFMKQDRNQVFNLTYRLNRSMLAGFVLEGQYDNKLTKTVLYFLPKSENHTLNIPFNRFEWLSDKDIKHLKMTYVQITWYDTLLIRLFLALKLDPYVNNWYIGPQ